MRFALLALSLVACGMVPGVGGGRPSPSPTARPLSVDEVTAITTRSKNATYEILYTVTGKLDGAAVGGEWTAFQKPPLSRIDMTLTGRDIALNMSTFVTPDGTISCDVASRSCSPLPATGGSLEASPLDGPLRDDPEAFVVTFLRRDRFAASDADCLRVRPRTSAAAIFREATLCYTDDGLPAFIEMELRDGKLTLEAQSLKRTIADPDVVFPFR